MKNADSLGLTKQRETVLKVIRSSQDHLTANEVYDAARLMLPGISFATVYNSLSYLKKEGLIGEVKFGTKAALYDHKINQHSHAVCNRCGKLVDLEFPIPDELLTEACRQSEFETGTIELTLRGLCPKCRKK